MQVAHYQAGEKIIRAGQHEQRMYIVLQGEVTIHLMAENRKDKVQVAKLGQNDFFGEISFFTNKPRSATVTAETEVKLAVVDNLQTLNAFLIEHPAFAAKMVRILAMRLAKTDEYLVSKAKEVERLEMIMDRYS
jgi:CRP-like cAMP-binding protein